mmetsp:Transcript_21835/g.60665  ORF Transcript_21835/g.60665 Transcript_21835/m.60665 type:complete len:233 (-) Transcript_21835:835-1533(-)
MPSTIGAVRLVPPMQLCAFRSVPQIPWNRCCYFLLFFVVHSSVDEIDHDFHRLLGLWIREETVVGRFDDAEFLVFVGRRRILKEQFRARHGHRHVVVSVDDAKGSVVSRDGLLPDFLHCLEQVDGRSQSKGIPDRVQSHLASLGVRVVPDDLFAPPDPIGTDRVGHEKGGPPGRERRQHVPQQLVDGKARKVTNDRGAHQERCVQVRRCLVGVVLKVTAGEDRETAPVGFSR